jgi:hypothetical protein
MPIEMQMSYGQPAILKVVSKTKKPGHRAGLLHSTLDTPLNRTIKGCGKSYTLTRNPNHLNAESCGK